MDDEKSFLFIGLVSMLSQGVMQHLGKIADPVSGQTQTNLEAAKSMIDLVMMLKDKTKGNLTADEERFLNTTLTNLQLNYIEEAKTAPTPDQQPKKTPS